MGPKAKPAHISNPNDANRPQGQEDAMGTALRFAESARAAFVARVLADQGFGVYWKPNDAPEVVMTACPQAKCREIIKANPGTFCEWWMLPEIDVSTTDKTRA